MMGTWFVALLLVHMLQSEQAPAGRADAGKAYWQGHMCQFCHGVAGEGGWGPDLAGRALSLAQFKRAIREPWGLMPAYTSTQVSDQSVADLHAFLSGLPTVAQPGPPRWRHPPAGGPEGQRLQSAFGCGQCHGPEMAVPRAWLLAADRLGGVPDAEFGVSKDAGFPYFAKMVYQHSEKYPKGTMGNFSRDRLPEVLLREIYRFMLDAGLRVRIEAALAVGAQQSADATYTLTVANVGRAKGLTAENLTIFIRVPRGTSVANATGTGYKGVRPLAQLGLTPALAAAPGAFTSGIPERPKPDLTGDVAVWEVPRIAATEKQIYTLTLSGPGPTAEVLRGFGGSTVHWEKPGVRMGPPQLVFRDLRLPDKGDQVVVSLPPPPKSP
jgi:cytochrome c553